MRETKPPMQSPVTTAGYVVEIEAMVHRGRAWLAEHPNADASVQWNFPEGVWLAAGFDQAMELNLVTLHGQAAAQLCAAMIGESREATVMMMRMAIELLPDQKITKKAGR